MLPHLRSLTVEHVVVASPAFRLCPTDTLVSRLVKLLAASKFSNVMCRPDFFMDIHVSCKRNSFSSDIMLRDNDLCRRWG